MSVWIVRSGLWPCRTRHSRSSGSRRCTCWREKSQSQSRRPEPQVCRSWRREHWWEGRQSRRAGGGVRHWYSRLWHFALLQEVLAGPSPASILRLLTPSSPHSAIALIIPVMWAKSCRPALHRIRHRSECLVADTAPVWQCDRR